MLAASPIETLRADVKIVANSTLRFQPELVDHIIRIDVLGEGDGQREEYDGSTPGAPLSSPSMKMLVSLQAWTCGC